MKSSELKPKTIAISAIIGCLAGLGVERALTDDDPRQAADTPAQQVLHTANTTELAVTCQNPTDIVSFARLNNANYRIICSNRLGKTASSVVNVTELDPMFGCTPVNYLGEEPDYSKGSNEIITLEEPTLDSINVSHNGLIGRCVYSDIRREGVHAQVEFLPSHMMSVGGDHFPGQG